MAVSFRAHTDNNDTGTAATNKPAGTASGDLLVAIVATYSSTTVTGPTGWTNKLSANDGSVFVTVWTKTATGSEPTSYSWGGGSGYLDTGIDGFFSSTSATLQLDGTPASANGSGGVCPSVTAANANEALVIGWATDGNASFTATATLNNSATLDTNGGTVAGDSGADGFAQGHKLLSATGATGSTTVSNVAAAGVGISLLVQEQTAATPPGFLPSLWPPQPLAFVTKPSGLLVPAPYTRATPLGYTFPVVSPAAGATPKAVSDTIGIAESVSVAVSVPIGESIALADAVSVAVTVPLAESVSIADTVSVAVGVPLSETISFSESVSVTVAVPLAESLTVADALTIAVSVPLADAVSFQDSPGVAVTLAVTDTLTFADAVSVGVPINVADSISLSDAVSVAVSVPLAEGLSLADAPTVAVTLAVADGLTLADTLSILSFVTLGDAITLTDAASVSTLGAPAPLPYAVTLTIAGANTGGLASTTQPDTGSLVSAAAPDTGNLTPSTPDSGSLTSSGTQPSSGTLTIQPA